MKQPWTIQSRITQKRCTANEYHYYIEEKKDDDAHLLLEHSVGFRQIRDRGSNKIPPKKSIATLATIHYHVDKLEDEIVDGDNHRMAMGWEPGRVMDAVESNQKSTNYGRQPKFGHPLCTNLIVWTMNSSSIHNPNKHQTQKL